MSEKRVLRKISGAVKTRGRGLEVRGKVEVVCLYVITSYSGLHSILNFALCEGKWSASYPGRLAPGKNSDNHSLGGWLGPSATLDVLERGKEISFPWLYSNQGLPARSQSAWKQLYDLYLSSNTIRVNQSRRRSLHVACIWERRDAYTVLVGKPEGKRPLRRLRCKWENNIKMYI